MLRWRQLLLIFMSDDHKKKPNEKSIFLSVYVFPGYAVQISWFNGGFNSRRMQHLIFKKSLRSYGRPFFLEVLRQRIISFFLIFHFIKELIWVNGNRSKHKKTTPKPSNKKLKQFMQKRTISLKKCVWILLEGAITLISDIVVRF